jgi:hypothetical protein
MALPDTAASAPRKYAFRQRYTKHNYSTLGDGGVP